MYLAFSVGQIEKSILFHDKTLADGPYDTYTTSDRAYYRQLCVCMMNRRLSFLFEIQNKWNGIQKLYFYFHVLV